MIVRGGGPTSGYISTGFYSGKCQTSSLSCVEYIFFDRPNFGPCHLGRGN